MEVFGVGAFLFAKMFAVVFVESDIVDSADDLYDGVLFGHGIRF